MTIDLHHRWILNNIYVELIFYQLKEEHKRRVHVKSSVTWLKCVQVRTYCQSKEHIFIDRQQKLNHILLYIHLWMDGHSLKNKTLYVINIVLSDMDFCRTAVSRGESRTFNMHSCPSGVPVRKLVR